MEDVYLKNFPREWHSDKVNLKFYFEDFSMIWKDVKGNKSSLLNIVKLLQPEVSVSKSEITQLFQGLSEAENELKLNVPRHTIPTSTIKGQLHTSTLTTVLSKKKNLRGLSKAKTRSQTKNNPQQKQDIEGKRNVTLLSKNKKLNKNHKSIITETRTKDFSDAEISLKILKLRGVNKAPKYKNCLLTTRSELLLDGGNNSKGKDLKKETDFVVSFRIQEPFSHTEESRIENFQQEILMLGSQTLEKLRDKIICQSDYQDVRGDVSNNPDGLVQTLSKSVYKSAMFYIDNTFYIDPRGEEDYSVVIKKWARPRGINVGQTKLMNGTAIFDLEIRFGYPYVYIHQGCCEHLVIISDARLLTGRDSLDSKDYPFMNRIPRPITQYCFTCLSNPSQWIVTESKRLPHDITYMCKTCFKMFNYVDGKKCENFKAYRFFQKNVLL